MGIKHHFQSHYQDCQRLLVRAYMELVSMGTQHHQESTSCLVLCQLSTLGINSQ